MSLTQGGGQLPAPSILPAFQGDVSQMRNFANSLGGQTVAPGAFNPSAGTMNAATMGNNYFGAGGAGNLGIGQLSRIFSGANLDPNSNPYLQDTINTMQQAFGKTLGSGTDMLNAQFAGSGQYGADSGARNNALTQFGRGAMSDFSNALGGELFGQYNQGQNQITSALGMMNQPLSGGSMASMLGQGPGQLQYQGQLAQNSLSSLPFEMMLQLMQAAPVSSPSFAPSQPSDLAGWLNMAMHGLDAGANAYSGSQMGALAAAMG